MVVRLSKSRETFDYLLDDEEEKEQEMGMDAYVCRMDRNRSRCADEERKEEKCLKSFGGGDRYFNVALWVLNFFSPSEVPLQIPALVASGDPHGPAFGPS